MTETVYCVAICLTEEIWTRDGFMWRQCAYQMTQVISRGGGSPQFLLCCSETFEIVLTLWLSLGGFPFYFLWL